MCTYFELIQYYAGLKGLSLAQIPSIHPQCLSKQFGMPTGFFQRCLEWQYPDEAEQMIQILQWRQAYEAKANSL